VNKYSTLEHDFYKQYILQFIVTFTNCNTYKNCNQSS